MMDLPFEVIKKLEGKARRSVLTKDKLEKRLLKALSLVMEDIKVKFAEYELDTKGKRLIGSDGYVLQWLVRDFPDLPASNTNVQNSRGVVVLLDNQVDVLG